MKQCLSDHAERRLKEIAASYPDPRSAIMAALYIAQEELKVLDQRAVTWVSERLAIPEIQVQEIITFYSMFRSRSIGRYHVQICRTLTCAVCGGKFIAEYLFKRFGIKPGELSADGMWSFEEVECLGSCGTAPVCMINDCLFEKLTPDKFSVIVDRIIAEKPDLSFSTVRDELGTSAVSGAGQGGTGRRWPPRSEII